MHLWALISLWNSAFRMCAFASPTLRNSARSVGIFNQKHPTPQGIHFFFRDFSHSGVMKRVCPLEKKGPREGGGGIVSKEAENFSRGLLREVTILTPGILATCLAEFYLVLSWWFEILYCSIVGGKSVTDISRSAAKPTSIGPLFQKFVLSFFFFFF